MFTNTNITINKNIYVFLFFIIIFMYYFKINLGQNISLKLGPSTTGIAKVMVCAILSCCKSRTIAHAVTEAGFLSLAI